MWSVSGASAQEGTLASTTWGTFPTCPSRIPKKGARWKRAPRISSPTRRHSSGRCSRFNTNRVSSAIAARTRNSLGGCTRRCVAKSCESGSLWKTCKGTRNSLSKSTGPSRSTPAAGTLGTQHEQRLGAARNQTRPRDGTGRAATEVVSHPSGEDRPHPRVASIAAKTSPRGFANTTSPTSRPPSRNYSAICGRRHDCRTRNGSVAGPTPNYIDCIRA